jgi:hypothetical protein
MTQVPFPKNDDMVKALPADRSVAPTVTTMMGGANCEGIMGQTTHKNFKWVDFVIRIADVARLSGQRPGRRQIG